jgi:hypothetical protein
MPELPEIASSPSGLLAMAGQKLMALICDARHWMPGFDLGHRRDS